MRTPVEPFPESSRKGWLLMKIGNLLLPIYEYSFLQYDPALGQSQVQKEGRRNRPPLI